MCRISIIQLRVKTFAQFSSDLPYIRIIIFSCESHGQVVNIHCESNYHFIRYQVFTDMSHKIISIFGTYQLTPNRSIKKVIFSIKDYENNH